MSTGLLRHDGPFWRGLATFGASHAPRVLVRYTPPVWAFAFALAMPKVRARVRRNLRRVLGPRPARQELADVFRTFAHFASCLTEGLALGGPRPPPVDCVVEGGEHLARAIERGRGAILVTAHTGGWEIAGPLLKKRYDLDVVIVMQRELDDDARRIQDGARQRSGVKVVHVGHEPLAALPLVNHLRRGGALGVQIDRVPDAMRALPVRLFGAGALVPSGPFQLARAAGSPVLPVFIRRLGYFRYEIRMGPAIEIPRAASPAVVSDAAQRAASEMEAFIQANPTHWFDFGRRA